MSIDLYEGKTKELAVPGAGQELTSALSGPHAAEQRPLAINVRNLTRLYKVRGEKKKKKSENPSPAVLTALDGVDLEVYEGELFGLLGPNGAGKTTLIKILTTLLMPSTGEALVDGLDVVKYGNEVRRRINMVSGGETSGYGILTVRENLWMFSQFYGVTWKDADVRIRELLKIVELEDKSNALISSLSTGQRQRMNFCRGFVTDPKSCSWTSLRSALTYTRPASSASSPKNGFARTHSAPCCSPPTTWPKPTSCATGSPSSTTARCLRAIRRPT